MNEQPAQPVTPNPSRLQQFVAKSPPFVRKIYAATLKVLLRTPKAFLWFVDGLPILVLYLVGLNYTFELLQNYNKDTTPISNAAFVIVATLAAITFSFARSLDHLPDEQDRIVFAGERLFHASLYLVVASVIKYALISYKAPEHATFISKAIGIIVSLIGFSVGVVFLIALQCAMVGIRILNKFLLSRLARHKDGNDIF